MAALQLFCIVHVVLRRLLRIMEWSALMIVLQVEIRIFSRAGPASQF